ncbi:hypothetical protein CA266_22480 [Serratia marcescens]|uniref:hypothetical protein n=1 Tax=Serratia marcescens TaxID=615 RepID=UPI00187F0BC0|nr:hypothetical protein [Serratia marcescens]QOV53627.1 hypothetical protein CA266_22480 [Serratia marcescens]
MELGSLTDWISAGANILMAGAAVYAAIIAKSWLDQKISDDVYNITKDLFIHDYPKIIRLCNDINFSTSNFDHKLLGFENTLTNEYTISVQEKLTTLGNNLKELTFNANEKIKALGKFNYRPIEDYRLYHVGLMKEVDMQITSVLTFAYEIESMRMSVTDFQVKRNIENIRSYNESITRKHTRIKSLYERLYNLKIEFMDYFRIS